MEKSCTLGFLYALFLFYVVSFVCVPFPLSVWGRMWNSIVSVPGHFPFLPFSSTFHEYLMQQKSTNLWTQTLIDPDCITKKQNPIFYWIHKIKPWKVTCYMTEKNSVCWLVQFTWTNIYVYLKTGSKWSTNIRWKPAQSSFQRLMVLTHFDIWLQR